MQPPFVSTQHLMRGDVLFISREDSLISQGIRFWTQSPFNHACIMKTSSVMIEADPTKGFMTHSVQDYLDKIAQDNLTNTRRPFGVWIVRPESIPERFNEHVTRVSLDGYDAESVLQNMIHMGNSDGPDHTIPIPWKSKYDMSNPHRRTVKTWEERQSFTCAELIARLLEFEATETFQWLPSSLFAKLLSQPGAQVFKLDTMSIQQAHNRAHEEAQTSLARAAKEASQTIRGLDPSYHPNSSQAALPSVLGQSFSNRHEPACFDP
jgi:hypothetical protein